MEKPSNVFSKEWVIRAQRARRRLKPIWPTRTSPRGKELSELDDPFLLEACVALVDPSRSKDEISYPQIGVSSNHEVEGFFRFHLGDDPETTRIIWSIKRGQVDSLPKGWGGIGVLQKINNSRWLNKYFRTVNSRLETGGVFVGCIEENSQRKRRFFRKYPFPFGFIRYCMDFAIHRFWPKLPILKRAYFGLTSGHNRSISTAEVLGRLVSCGFEIVEHREIGDLIFFAVRKSREASVVIAPTYGPFCALKRMGRGDKPVRVYKFRTMHPYAEFLQDYVYQLNDLDEGGKFRDDFRVPTWGKWLRRLWLDELPMIINVFKGDMKLVGVRPLSLHYFSLYPTELQELRIRFTPGLLPPFYADLPKSFEDIVESELKYLRAYEKAPFRTDLRYFCLAVRNIVIKRARSA